MERTSVFWRSIGRVSIELALLTFVCACDHTPAGPSQNHSPSTQAFLPQQPDQLVAPPVHLPSEPICNSPRPASRPADGKIGPEDQCINDASCTQGVNGRCLKDDDGRFCSYDTCGSAKDCPVGYTCDCRGGPGKANRCIKAACRSDGDCGFGGYCSPSAGDCGGAAFQGVVGHYCRTTSDECVQDEDCMNLKGERGVCRFFEQKQHWGCHFVFCDE